MTVWENHEPRACVAMLLAGGQGSRLGVLTEHLAKPAVPFGGKYRIIDFTLSNCTNSGIDSVGLLTQYQPLRLNTYIGIGRPWDLDRMGGGLQVLPPFISGKRGEWYQGTANAVYQNIPFIEQNMAQRVLVLSGDHVYKMDYSKMIAYHREKRADATIAVIEVPWEDASRFGIMNTDADTRIVEFDEKPAHPKNNLASMGVYVFEWDVLRRFLVEDEADPQSSHDFGKNVIPAMLAAGCRMVAYPFSGYWKDVGTIESLWEAHMDLLEDPPKLDLHDESWRIYSRNPTLPPHYIGRGASVTNSLISEGCTVYGDVDRSILFPGAVVAKGAVVRESVVMPNASIGPSSTILRAIVAEDAQVGASCVVGEMPGNDGAPLIAVIGEKASVPDGTRVAAGAQIGPTSFSNPEAATTAAGGDVR